MLQDKERISRLLGSGLSQEIVATTVGCDAGYISQLMSDEQFRQQVLALRIESLTKDTERDRSVDSIEDSLIEKIKATLDYLVTPKDILRAYMIMNAAKRRGAKSADTTVVNNNIVNLNLPPIIVQKYVLSKNNEVVEVEGKSLVTIPAHRLLADRKERSDSRSKEATTVSSLAVASSG